MYKQIKYYVSLLQKYNSVEKISDLQPIEELLSNYNSNELGFRIKDLEVVLKTLNIDFPIGIYFDYYKTIDIDTENIINDTQELKIFLSKNINLIFETGGLNCYVDINIKHQFLQLHYQDSIILYEYNG